MKNYEFRVAVEKVAVQSQKVVKRETLKMYAIQKPESIIDLFKEFLRIDARNPLRGNFIDLALCHSD